MSTKMARNTILVIVLMDLLAVFTNATTKSQVGEVMEEKEEDKVNKGHITDSLNLLIYIGLLILVVLTIWLFKHRRLRFVHETGLAILYGLIVGAIIRYSSAGATVSSEFVDLPVNTTYGFGNPPDNLKLRIQQNASVEYFQYDYKAQIDESDVNEKQLEDKVHRWSKATFDPEVFFNVLLPPIIFNAGYSMKRKSFFKNFGAIMTYAFLGTAISTFVVGAITYGVTRLLPYLTMGFKDCCFFGAIISATDPVTVLAIFGELNADVDLYALVFGESVLNDAVAIVLSKTVEDYDDSTGGFDGIAILRALGNFLGVFFGAFALGSLMGCVTALLTKYTYIRDYPLLETSLFFLMSYGTFLAAEAAQMTGIVAVLFCGICQAHYTYNNLSKDSKLWTKQIFELLNFLMENFVFTYIGVSTFTFQQHYWDGIFIVTAFAAIIVARACNVYPLSFLLNLGRSNKIRYNFQHMLMFTGLRGAIAFALAIRNTSDLQRRLTFSTTLVIVIVTVIFCGGLSTQMLQWLKIRVGVEDESELQNFEAVRTAMGKQRQYQTMDHTPDDTSHTQDSRDVAVEMGEDRADGGGAGVNPSPSEPLPPEVHQSHQSRLSEKAMLVIAWYKIDMKFVKPLLTHARPPLTETLPKCMMPLAKLLTTEEQLSGSGSRTHRDSDTDLIINEHELAFGDHNGIGGDAAAAAAATEAGNDTGLHTINSSQGRTPPHIEAATGMSLEHPLSAAARRPNDLDLGVKVKGHHRGQGHHHQDEDAAENYMTDIDPLLHRPTVKVRAERPPPQGDLVAATRGIRKKGDAIGMLEEDERVEEDCPLLDA